MNTRQIEAFKAIMEVGSVTRAAELLNISQPAVSRLLKAFEQNCGFTLFDRIGGRLVATSAAQRLITEVERVFSGVDRIEAVAQSLREGRSGRVTVASFPALALRVLPDALAAHLAEREDVELVLQSRTSRRIGELVTNQQVDLGLSLLPIDHPHVHYEELVRFRMVCVVPAGHPLAGVAVIRPPDLRDLPFVTLGTEDRSRFGIDEVFHEANVHRRIRIEAQMAETACSFVANGLGVAIVPPMVVDAYQDPRIVARCFEPAVKMSVWLLMPTPISPTCATLEIRDRIRQALAVYQSD